MGKIENLGAFKARLHAALFTLLLAINDDPNAPTLHISVSEEDAAKLSLDAAKLKADKQQIVAIKLAENKKGADGLHYQFGTAAMRDAVLRQIQRRDRAAVKIASARQHINLDGEWVVLDGATYSKPALTNLEKANKKNKERSEKQPVKAQESPAKPQEETAPNGDEEPETDTDEKAPKRGKKKDQ